MNTPDTIQTLFIRACKSKDPHTRVDSVYRRFFLSLQDCSSDVVITSLLIEIVDKFCPINITKLMQRLAPDDYFFEDDCYWTRAKKVLISHIRLSHKDCFGNMRVPLMFRGK